jgi:predicted acylesterase/phospholipase RssA
MEHSMRDRMSAAWILIAVPWFMTACSTLPRLDAVPVASLDRAHVSLSDGYEGIRFRVGDVAAERALAEELVQSWNREREHLATRGEVGPLPPAAFLALSGGGDNGAFGAGVLSGWTIAGNRPYFKLVTGISTGALIAPFAFLGPAYDGHLKAFFTTTSAHDVLETRSLLKGLTSDAMADTAPLRRLIERHMDRALLDAIAAEYANGRELWIGTTNLDSMQRYIWNMTRIAASKDPKARELFISLMLASAAIPGAFPPVLIDVEIDGKKYQEMHVDGGAMAQVFVYPLGLDFDALATRYYAERQRSLYIIRNARIDAEWAQTTRRTYSIAERAITSLIQAQGVGDLFRIYLQAERDGLDFKLAHIPASFNAPHKEEFDPDYMHALFDVGFELAAKGYPWLDAPPGVVPTQH